MADTCNLTTRVELPYPDIGADDWGADFNAKIQLADALIASLQDDNTFLGDQTISDGKFVGLGSAKGRFQFDDETTDTITVKNATLLLNNILGNDGDADTYLTMATADSAKIFCGSLELLSLIESGASSHVDINAGGLGTVAFNVYSDSLLALTIAGDTGAAVFGSTVRGTAFAVGIAPSLVAPYQLYSTDIAATTAYYGLSIDITKTTGASDAADHQYGVNVRYILNQSGGVTGHLIGAVFEVQVDNGATGAARDIIGVEGLLDLNTGTGTQDVMGGYSRVDIEATFSTTRDVFGHRIEIDPDGDIGGAVYGLYSYIDQAAGKTITGATYVAYLGADLDGTTTGSTYMLYLKENSGIDFGIYQDGTAQNVLGGQLRLNGGLCIEDGQFDLAATTTTAGHWRMRTSTTTCYLEYSVNGTDYTAYGTFTAA